MTRNQLRVYAVEQPEGLRKQLAKAKSDLEEIERRVDELSKEMDQSLEEGDYYTARKISNKLAEIATMI